MTGHLRANGEAADDRSCCSKSPDPQLATSQWKHFRRDGSVSSLVSLCSVTRPPRYRDSLLLLRHLYSLEAISLTSVPRPAQENMRPNQAAGCMPPFPGPATCRQCMGPPRWNVMAAGDRIPPYSELKILHFSCQAIVSQTNESSVGRLFATASVPISLFTHPSLLPLLSP